jgi:tectonic-1/3
VSLKNVALFVGRTFQQRFTVTFTNANVTLTRRLSGNPGYRVGYPVLAGTLAKNGGKEAIEYDPLVTLSLARDVYEPSSKTIGCSSMDSLTRAPVEFMTNTLTSCTLYYSRSNLTNNCPSIRTNILNIQTLGLSSFSHVGKFGNANYLISSDWIEILNTVPSVSVSFLVTIDRIDHWFCWHLPFGGDSF